VCAIVHGRLIYAPCDDAYIFYVYARNFVEGRGLTFNGMTVQGFTSVLWAALLAIAGLSRAPLPIIGEVLSAASGVFALWATYRLGRRIGLDRPRALLPPLLLALTSDFAFYSAVGLEEVLFSGLVALVAATSLSSGERPLARPLPMALLMAAMVLTRPEGALLCAVFLVIVAFQDRSPRRAFVLCGILASVVAPVFAALRSVYGDWLPCTYYVKSDAGLANIGSGLHYFGHHGPRYAPALLLAAATGVRSALSTRFSGMAHPLILLGLTAVWLAYVTLVGGDNLAGGRMFLPALPLAYVAAVRLAAACRVRTVLIAALVVAAAQAASYHRNAFVQGRVAAWRRNFPLLRAAGIHLRDSFPPETLVALNTAGVIPYYSRLPTIDMLGLNNRQIARHGRRDRTKRFGHQVGDGAYVLSQRPDVILLDGPPAVQPGDFVGDEEIWSSPEFRTAYRATDWPGAGTAYIRKKRKAQ
jgi:hypothetical protein